MNEQKTPHDAVDQAMRNRLAKLRQTPVDTGRLNDRLNATMARMMTAAPPRPAVAGRITRLRHVLALAAMIAIITGAAATLLTVGQTPAVASPTELARVHRGFLDDSAHSMHVESVDQANRVISEQWPEAPAVPTPAAGPISACCVDMVNRIQVVCAHLEHRGKPVTMVVAKSSQMHCAPGETVQRDGRTFQVHQSEGLTMVMMMRADRCVCLVSELDTEALLDLASQLRFD